jgi:EpsI family protein
VQLSNWVGTDVPIPPETLNTLGTGEFLQRQYINDRTEQPDVNLYLAYLANGRALFNHLPQDCLAGSGWTTVESGPTTLRLPGEADFPANRYLIERGTDRQVVLFWYWAHGRRVASEDWTNLYLVFDALRLKRSDYALIRMNTALQVGEKPEQAERRLLAFAGVVNPLLDNYIPR